MSTDIELAREAFKLRDFNKALALYSRLAANGSSSAFLGLATIYGMGNEDVPQDYSLARYWYEKAFASKSAAASTAAGFALAEMNATGSGAPIDYKRAFFYYSKLAENRNPYASYARLALGIMYERGRGVPTDPSSALALYTLAAREGSIVARYLEGKLQIKNGRLLLGLFLSVPASIQIFFIRLKDPRDIRAKFF